MVVCKDKEIHIKLRLTDLLNMDFMKIGISLDELLISKSLFVISLVFLCKLHRNRIAETSANFSCEVFPALDYFIPDLFIQVI